MISRKFGDSDTFNEDTYWIVFREFIVTIITVFISFAKEIFRFIIPKHFKNVRNKVVLITGAGHGLGRQLSIEFFKLGAIVILWDTDAEGLEETTRQLFQNESVYNHNDECGYSRIVYDYICDVGNKDDVYRVGQRVKKEVGDVDILVNNAAIVTGKPILDIPDERIVKIFNVNLLAHFWTVKCFLPAMLERDHGHIVTIASSCGFAGINNLIDYCATKFGVMGFSEVLNYENTFSGHHGVHVTTICPSFIKTGMFHGCRMRYQNVTPDLEVKATVERMMSGILREEHFVYIPGRIGLVPFCKSLLPHEAWIAVMKFFGGDKFMDSFQGHAGTT